MPRTGLTAEELKQRAIDYAEEAIRRMGFERVRLVEVAREPGVSHVALSKRFADKSARFDAVSAPWLAQVQAQLERVCAPAQPA